MSRQVVFRGGQRYRARSAVGAAGNRVQVTFQPSPATSDLDVINVALFGHSYVRHLHTDLRPITHQGRRFMFHWHFVSGGTVDKLYMSGEYQDLSLLKPAVTYLIVGGNDIRPDTVPKDLAIKIENLAKNIERDTGGKVRIIGLESRTNPRNMAADQYNKIKNSVNMWLKSRLAWSRIRYSSMHMGKYDLSNDGVHLNAEASVNLRQRLEDDIRRMLGGGRAVTR